MKIVIEYNIPDDQYDYSCAMNASKLASVLKEYDQKLKSIVKHGDPTEYDARTCRAMLWELIKDEGVNAEVILI